MSGCYMYCLIHMHEYQLILVRILSLLTYLASLIPRPSTPPVCDHLQYKTGGVVSQTGDVEDLGTRLNIHTTVAHNYFTLFWLWNVH